MEAVACSWPTPFGFLLPGLMGRVAVKSWSLGEVALLFSMTRPTLAAETVPFEGPHAVDRVAPSCRSMRARGVFHLVRGAEVRRRIRRHKEMQVTGRPRCFPGGRPLFPRHPWSYDGGMTRRVARLPSCTRERPRAGSSRG